MDERQKIPPGKPGWMARGRVVKEGYLDIHEYQAKEILANFGVATPHGAVAYSPDQAVYCATELGGWHWAVKAQIHSGARGKAGGVKLCKTYNEVRAAAAELLGKTLVT